MAALVAAIDRGETGAVERFWSEIAQEGAPLIERGRSGTGNWASGTKA